MPAIDTALLTQAESLLPETVALRRTIHRHPELGNDLPKTKQTVLDALGSLDLELAHSEKTSGFVAKLDSGRDGPTVLLRGDMDALPMAEDTGVDYASEVNGAMHACGHDAHTAMLVGAAKLLDRHRDSLRGTVKFMFQPGEEGHFGARFMIEEGILDAGGPPDAAFALHVYPNVRSGVIAARSGPLLAAADSASITLTGKGGHGSMPHNANDPIPVACELVQAFQTFVTRRIDPFDPIVLTVGRIQAGTTNNVIPESAEMDITVRSFSKSSRDKAHEGIHRLARSVAEAHEMKAEVVINEGYPPTLNDAGMTDVVARAARKLLGDDGFVEMSAPVMGAEDFSFVLQRYPGAFAFLGVAPKGVDPGEAPACHSNRMTIDETAMAAGIAMHAAFVFENQL